MTYMVHLFIACYNCSAQNQSNLQYASLGDLAKCIRNIVNSRLFGISEFNVFLYISSNSKHIP